MPKSKGKSRTKMSAKTSSGPKAKSPARVTAIPKGHERVTPHLIIDGAAGAIDFYKKAFDAKEISRAQAPGGGRLMHAEIQIGQSRFFLADEFPEFGGTARSPKALGGSSVTIHQYVKNVDKVVEQAARAGATVKMPPMDAFWGDRYAVISD
ncbi:MAG: VOC family protein, partial [Candidatus Zixiibacteriota bacterium]